MKLKILMFRANVIYRLAIVANKVFDWSCERHTKLFNQCIREIKRGSENGSN